jgi:4-amino-4-deoxy-L-arabinose transferase-like glycosyltransferase
VLRVWILSSPLGALESDEAITGLMARHALDGEFHVLYWLSFYGGTQEALLSAAVFSVFGSSVLTLKLTALALFVAAAPLLWLLGRRTVGERAAWYAVALYGVYPAWFVWWTTKARAYYGVGLICELLVLLLVLRLRERDSRADALALGFVLGFGVWASYQFLLLGAPALVWLAWRRPAVLRRVPLVAGAFVVGAAPWLAWNATHDWAAVLPKTGVGVETSFLGRLWDLFSETLPTWLGLRIPYTLDWLVPPVVGAAVTVLAVAGFAYLLVRRPRGLELLLVVGAAYPFVYAASSFTYLTFEPRYLLFLLPVSALLLGRLAARGRVAYVLLPVALALTVWGLARMEHQGRFTPVPADMSPVIRVLEREHVTRVLASYWIAYRLSFETDERIIGTSTGFVRYQPHDRLVRSSPYPARVFKAGLPAERAARQRLEARGFRRIETGGYVIYVHTRST